MRFAVAVCRLLRDMPNGEPAKTVKRQLAKASTAVAINYRAACRGRSHDEFTAKLGVVAEEADETQGWLEFAEAAGLLTGPGFVRILTEATEIASIMSRSYGTARFNQRKRRGTRPPI